MSSSSSSPPISEGARHPATLSTSVDPVACFDSVAADEGNDDPSSLPWALPAHSSLVAPSADCCVARLLPLSSPSPPPHPPLHAMTLSRRRRLIVASRRRRLSRCLAPPSPLPSSPSLLTSLARPTTVCRVLLCHHHRLIVASLGSSS